MEETPTPLTRKVARFFAWTVAVVAALYVFSVWWEGVRSEAEFGLDGTSGWIALGGAVVLVLAILGLLALYGKAGDGALIALFISGLFAAYSAYALYQMIDEPEYAWVTSYCAYVAEDGGEFDQCMTLMTPGSVKFADNENAVEFALGDGECEADAGPLCERAKASRDFDRMIDEAQSEN